MEEGGKIHVTPENRAAKADPAQENQKGTRGGGCRNTDGDVLPLSIAGNRQPSRFTSVGR
jgi:hypothetical protein